MLIAMVEVNEQSTDKNDSEMSHVRQSEEAEQIIKELNDMRGLAKDKVEQLIEQLRKDKLKDHEIKKVLFSRVDFVSRPTLYRALPQEFKREYTKPLPKTINISTPHKVIEQSDHDWHYEQGEKEEEAEIKKGDKMSAFEHKTEAEEPERDLITPVEFKEEDPKDTEIQFLKEKVAELEDALKKTEQFKPATSLTVGDDNTNGLNWLQKRADGIHSFYYDTYGIDLFKNRELSQLKNSGVKVFKRLYFEV